MLYFECDYNNGAHEAILRRLAETNGEAAVGYGEDQYCESAREKILKACQCPNGDVYFISGGTQANAVVISSVLSVGEGVFAAETGHIAAHEAGAIENTGHKVLTLPAYNGKMKAADLKKYMISYFEDPSHEHVVCPGMVYISHPTEYGTLYSKKELEDLSAVCREYGLPLFMDGARLGYGLMSREADVTLPDIARLCDVFYIGGTKVGALCGEAVVFTKNNTPKHFFNSIKRCGALMAKGRLMGIQFDTLFTDGLYFEISKNAIDTAELLKEGLKQKGYKFYMDSPTNQQFVVISNEQAQSLKEKVNYSFWERVDEGHIVIRLATSWATTREEVEELLSLL